MNRLSFARMTWSRFQGSKLNSVSSQPFSMAPPVHHYIFNYFHERYHGFECFVNPVSMS